MIALRNPKTGEEFTANESFARRAQERGFVKVEEETKSEAASAEEKATSEKKSRKAKDGGAE